MVNKPVAAVGVGSFVPRYRVDVFRAGLSAKHCGSGFDPPHANPFQQPYRRQISRISDGDDPGNRRMLKNERDRLTHGFRAETSSLSCDIQCETDLCRLDVRRHTDPNVANQYVGAAVGDAELHPPVARKERGMTHVDDEL